MDRIERAVEAVEEIAERENLDISSDTSRVIVDEVLGAAGVKKDIRGPSQDDRDRLRRYNRLHAEAVHAGLAIRLAARNEERECQRN